MTRRCSHHLHTTTTLYTGHAAGYWQRRARNNGRLICSLCRVLHAIENAALGTMGDFCCSLWGGPCEDPAMLQVIDNAVLEQCETFILRPMTYRSVRRIDRANCTVMIIDFVMQIDPLVDYYCHWFKWEPSLLASGFIWDSWSQFHVATL